MASIDIIAEQPKPNGEGKVWVRLPAIDETTGKPTKAPKGARYRARWRTPEGASRVLTFDRKIDAENHLATMTHKKLTGEYVDRSEGKTTVGAYARAWVARQPHRRQTAESWLSILEHHIAPTFDARPIGLVRTSEVQAWLTGLSKSLSASTTKMVYNKLAGIFRAAVADRVISTSPCTREVKLPKADGGETTPMDPAEVRAIADAMEDRYAALVVLMAGTGLRPAEATGLCESRVLFLKRSIKVDQQLITKQAGEWELATPKTPTSNRTIPAPQSVLDSLARHVERFPVEDGPIFTTAKGAPVTRNVLRRAWARAAKVAGVEGRSPHDLRHFAASVMIDQGANVKQVQKHLGHSSATVTLDTYSHLWPDSDDVTRRALEAGLGKVFATEPEATQQAL